MNDEPVPIKFATFPEKKWWEKPWMSHILVLISIGFSILVAYMGWQINKQITYINVASNDNIAKRNENLSNEIAKKNQDISKRIHDEDVEFKKRSDTLARALAQTSIDQQKITWTVSLLPHLSSSDSKLQLYASLVLKDLKEKGVFPDQLMPAIAKAAFDVKTDPDAARILKELLGNKKGQYSVNLGSNMFVNVPFPLSLDERRYFVIRSDKGQFYISVIASNDNVAEFEIIKNKPVSNSISNVFMTDKHTLVVSSLDDGNQVYMVNVGREIDMTYLLPNKPVNIKVSSDKIFIGGSSFSGNSIQGFPVGIIVYKNGGLALGAGRIPARTVSELYDRVLRGE